MDLRASPRLVLQRIRNRVIEYLEVVSSFDQQRQYQRAAPHVSVPNEMINQWEDWVDDERIETYREPVFSADEHFALRAFHGTWNAVASSTPDPLPPLHEVVVLAQWEQLRAAGAAALDVFLRRGRFSDER